MNQSNSYYNSKTKKGYSFFMISSTFQKAIRRGEEDLALRCMVELYESNYDEYLWKRIKIITSEDVGLANPILPAVIQSLYQSYIQQKKLNDEKHRPERLFLTHAVLLLVRTEKSRLVDWTLIKYWNTHPQSLINIPDYAYDKHTAQGRSMGRGIDHFYKEGSLINNEANLVGEHEAKLHAYQSEDQKKPDFEQTEMRFDE